MNTIVIPRLYCPFVSAINPYATMAKKHTDQWVARFGLFAGKSFEKNRDDNYSGLAARFYPTAGYEQLCIAMDLYELLFALDDQLDNQLEKAALIQKEESLLYFMKEVTAITNGEKTYTEKSGQPVLAALSDVWQRLKKISSETALSLFAKSLEELFAAALWEFRNANSGELPTLEQYLRLRQYLGAARVATDLIELVEQIHLPVPITQHASVQAITEACCNVICIANDLFSLSKELAHGDEHNLVSVLKNERGITMDEAILQAVDIHNKEVEKFEFLQKQLPLFNATTDKMLRQYVHILSMQIAGNITWSESETKRYSFVYEHDFVTQ
jgi:hypothetical protein